jgi:tetratricopeptide (TPR) repeat protein
LGNAGDLTPRTLADGVYQAALRLAAGHLDRHGTTDPPALTVASVLIGTAWVPAVPVENAVLAIVEGVRRANRRLRDLVGRSVVERLRIVELYEERAIQAMRAATRMPTSPDPGATDLVMVDPRMHTGCDGAPGSPPPDYQEGGWRTIRIAARQKQGGGRKRLSELSFTSIGRAARAEQVVGVGQRATIEALVKLAVDDPQPDPQLLNTLYELIVPNALKEQLYGNENLMLMLDAQTAALPLEMLATRTRDEGITPLCVEAGVVRRLETSDFAEAVRRATGQAALVIGDLPAGRGLPRLPGAREEAARVARVLTDHGYDVTAIILGPDETRTDIVEILNALFRREYRVVHIAGHGAYAKDPTRSGVMLGTDRVLGPLEIGQMRCVPDLVFLNCCHLGTVPRKANQLASGISQRLIANGVRAVIAAGWAVDDRAATTFADVFYNRLLDGLDLGTAALRARQEVYRLPVRTNTWGAYQVYGPPGLRLVRATASTRRPDAILARRELRDALDELLGRASNAREPEAEAIARELQRLLDAAPSEWLGAVELLAAGEVWTALARYQEAIGAFEDAHRDVTGEASLRSIERLANVKAKWAVERHKAGCDAAGLLDEARERLQTVLQLGRTPERLRLLASVDRRRALCSTGEERKKALARAAKACHEAVRLHREATGRVEFYAALNAVVLDVAIAGGSLPTPQRRRLTELVDGARAAAAESRCPNFWSRVTPADADLAQALVNGRIDDAEAIVDRYREAFRDSSRAQRVTVRESIEIVAATLEDTELAAQVDRLRDRIEELIKGSDDADAPSVGPDAPG